MTTLSVTQHTLSNTLNTEISVIATLQLWIDRHAQRKSLAQLDSSQLNDIGITKQQAITEAKRPFWK